jgi:hypothetical protein
MKRDAFESSIPEGFTKDISFRMPGMTIAVFVNGAVRVRWDDFGPAWDVDLLREDLIINDKDLKTLKRKAESPDSSPRQWSDQSGKFKVLAWLDSIRVWLRIGC